MPMLPLLVLHLLILLPGRSWSAWSNPRSDSHVWYHSLQTAGERFEDHVLLIELLLQQLDTWMEWQLEAFDKLLSDHIKNLQEWLEEHTTDLNVWLNLYFWTLQKFHDRYIKDSDYMLGRDILLHDNYWDEYMNKADMWLEDPNVTLYKWLEEAPPIIYRAWGRQGDDVGSSVQEYIENQTHHLEDHVRILEELLDNYTATASKWLDVHATIKHVRSQKSTRNLLHAAPLAEKLGSTQAIVFQRKYLSVMEWVEEHIDALEQWLWGTTNQRKL
nr:uncharacterized protein LOC110078973 [Pogona vitticeps]